MKTREESIAQATEHVQKGLNGLQEPIAIIQVVASVCQQLLANKELIRIVATAMVDIQEQIELIQSKNNN